MIKFIVYSLLALLLVLHQDYWQWDDATLDWGFMPRGLTYHVGISIAGAVVWLLAVQFCWPRVAGESPQGDDPSEPTQ